MNHQPAPAPPRGYAQTLTAAGLCFVSGQVPVDSDGNQLPEDDLVGQAELVFTKLQSCLSDQGLEMSDLVSITTYLRRAADGPEVSAVRGRYLGEHRPTSTVVEVSGLLNPAWRLEVQAVAAHREPAQQ